jgi:protease I
MESKLAGKRIAILVADGFEQVEMTKPRQALEEAGAKTVVISPAKGEVQGWRHSDKANKFKVDVPLERAQPADYDALLLPGGVANPDQLRMLPKAVQSSKASSTITNRWRPFVTVPGRLSRQTSCGAAL